MKAKVSDTSDRYPYFASMKGKNKPSVERMYSM